MAWCVCHKVEFLVCVHQGIEGGRVGISSRWTCQGVMVCCSCVSSSSRVFTHAVVFAPSACGGRASPVAMPSQRAAARARSRHMKGAGAPLQSLLGYCHGAISFAHPTGQIKPHRRTLLLSSTEQTFGALVGPPCRCVQPMVQGSRPTSWYFLCDHPAEPVLMHLKAFCGAWLLQSGCFRGHALSRSLGAPVAQ